LHKKSYKHHTLGLLWVFYKKIRQTQNSIFQTLLNSNLAVRSKLVLFINFEHIFSRENYSELLKNSFCQLSPLFYNSFTRKYPSKNRKIQQNLIRKSHSNLGGQLAYNEDMTFAELRIKHSRFIYQSFSWSHTNELLVIEFKFLLEPDIPFTAQLTIDSIKAEMIQNIGRKQLDNLIFHLGLIELFSYWKIAAPQQIIIEAGQLDSDQLAWWKTLLLRGMGEFFYTNQIDFTAENFVEWVCLATNTQSTNAQSTNLQSGDQVVKQADKQSAQLLDRSTDQITQSENQASQPNNQSSVAPSYLVPVGGGKDSALVIELLEENNLPYDALLSYPQSPAAAQIAGLSRANNIIKITRQLDPKLLQLNQANYLNGHTPFSARLAFETSLVATLLGHQQILLGNEFSANEGNVPFHDTTVNHQYSKTFEFEQVFRQYAQKYLVSAELQAPEYLSLLRPIFELQIAAIFAQYPRYHSIFRSCNRGQQTNVWCHKCAKCLFVFTILYPFLDENQLIGPIFTTNLFEDETLKSLTLALLGQDKHKPFECVGTYQETLVAFALSKQKFQDHHPDQPLPVILQFVQENILAQIPNLDQLIQETLCFWNDQHHLNDQLSKIVKSAQTRLCQQFSK